MTLTDFFIVLSIAHSTSPPGGPRLLRPLPPRRCSLLAALYATASHGRSMPAPIHLQTRHSASPPTILDPAAPFKTHAKSPSLLCPP